MVGLGPQDNDIKLVLGVFVRTKEACQSHYVLTSLFAKHQVVESFPWNQWPSSSFAFFRDAGQLCSSVIYKMATCAIYKNIKCYKSGA